MGTQLNFHCNCYFFYMFQIFDTWYRLCICFNLCWHPSLLQLRILTAAQPSYAHCQPGSKQFSSKISFQYLLSWATPKSPACPGWVLKDVDSETEINVEAVFQVSSWYQGKEGLRTKQGWI